MSPARGTLPKSARKTSMAVLSTKTRNALAASVFGLPGKRSYPMPDAAHARNAKARAAEEFDKGNLSAAEKAQIDRKADQLIADS
jgi:hypothetical protein